VYASIYDEVTYPFKKGDVIWELKAVHPIPAKDFKLTIPKIPQGFQQVFPGFYEAFTPKPGGFFHICVLIEDSSWGSDWNCIIRQIEQGG
jgi:hypothetical protein